MRVCVQEGIGVGGEQVKRCITKCSRPEKGRQELWTCCAELLPAAPCCWFGKVHQVQLAWARKRPVSYQPAAVLLLLLYKQALRQPATAAAQPSSRTWQVDECEVHRGARYLHNHHVPAELQACVLTRLSSPQGHACCIPCCCAAVLVVAKAGGRVQGVAFAVVSSSRPPRPSQQAGLCC